MRCQRPLRSKLWSQPIGQRKHQYFSFFFSFSSSKTKALGWAGPVLVRHESLDLRRRLPVHHLQQYKGYDPCPITKRTHSPLPFQQSSPLKQSTWYVRMQSIYMHIHIHMYIYMATWYPCPPPLFLGWGPWVPSRVGWFGSGLDVCRAGA